MRQINLQTSSRRQQALTITAALLIFASLALLSWQRSATAQGFVDRITRPCASGGGRSLVQTTSTDVLINPCTGDDILVNGVPLVITPGGGLGDPGSNGVVIRTALNTTVARTLTVSSPLTIANATGVAGNPLIACATCVTAAGTLTSTALMTGAGTKAAQTPAATATLAANGNISTPGSVTTGNGGGANGALDLLGLTSGTVTMTVNAVAGTWTLTLPINDGNASEFLQTNGAGVTTWAAVPAGVTANPTVGVIPYLSAANVYSDSPFTRLSATHVQLFANAAGGFDFDSSTPAITLNGTGALMLLGDPSGNGTQARVDDALDTVFLDANASGDGGAIHLTANGGQQQIDLYVPNVGATKYTELLLDGLLTKSSLIADATRVDLFGLTGIATVTATLTSVTGEFQAPLTIRTGTASNTDVAGTLTVGGGGTITYTFTQTYATAPVCTSDDTDTTPLITGSSATTTTLTVRGTAGHVVSYQCIGLN